MGNVIWGLGLRQTGAAAITSAIGALTAMNVPVVLAAPAGKCPCPI